MSKKLLHIKPELLKDMMIRGDTWMARYLHLEQLLLGQGIDYRHVREMSKEEIYEEAERTWLAQKGGNNIDGGGG